MIDIVKKIVRFFRTRKEHRQAPLRLEFVLSDYCNLNCKGCTHYSPVAPKKFEPIERLTRNMERLGRVCGSDIPRLYLIGGEPLLYPHLVEAMQALRRSFPEGEISLFTNGLALPRMSEEFWAACRSERVIVALTRYPVKFDYDAVERLCAEKGVECQVFGDRSEKNSFFRFGLDPKKRQNARIAHFKCFQFGCVSVIGDRIFPCSMSGCVGHLNERFGTDFRHEKGDYLMVDQVRSAADIRRLRDRPVPFCAYCDPKLTVVSYGPSRRDPSEWINND